MPWQNWSCPGFRGRNRGSTPGLLELRTFVTKNRCEPVKGRGSEVAKGQYLLIEDTELGAIEIESTHIIEIDSFVPRSAIDQRFFDIPYYRTSRSDRRPLPLFARPCAASGWCRSGSWCSRSASG